MNLGKRIIAEIQTSCEYKKYQANKDAIRKAMIELDLMFPNPTIEDYSPHPNYTEHFVKCNMNFLKYAASEMYSDSDKTLGIGDSILNQCTQDIKDELNPLLNMSLGGMRPCHMLRLLKDMDGLFTKYSFIPKYIVVGTPGGNSLLIHREINDTISQCKILFDYIRKKFPTTKIILYSIPMTIVDYLISHIIEYNTALTNWMLQDKNAVMIPLIKVFVQEWHILPKADYSVDGVHLSPIGRLYFNDLIHRGKLGIPGQFIN